MDKRVRRRALGGVAAASVAGLTAAQIPWAGAEPGREDASSAPNGPDPAPPETIVGRDDPRYRSLANRSYNRRFAGTPDQVHLAGSTAEVMKAVGAAVREGKRIAIRGGGHGFEDFVDDPAVRVVIDMARMSKVSYDERRRAFVVEAGATLGEVYRQLYLGWGATIPAGTNPAVGVGGHVAGAGYGALCRLHGLTVDHLYAVEVVVVDRKGRPRTVVASREPGDPNRDLWWAHTGGGGGNFGVITRYWFRSPGASGDDPSGLLPAPPSSVLSFTADWPWPSDDPGDPGGRETFTRLVGNYARWCEQNAGPGSPAAALYGEFVVSSRPSESISMTGQVSADSRPGRILDDMVAALGAGVGHKATVTTRSIPWLTSVTEGLTNEPGPIYRVKIKSGYPRRGFTDRQIATLYRHLTRPDYQNPGGLLSINTYGGKVNTVPAGATAMPHRSSVQILAYIAGWLDAREDGKHLSWIRELYTEMYAESGGVPVDDGTFVNYPDVDLADPELNTSGVPWHRLYYRDSYRRLQKVKRRWDPLDVFHHTLAIRP